MGSSKASAQVNLTIDGREIEVEEGTTILEAARLKSEGRLERLIVAGCLVQRYRAELEAAAGRPDHREPRRGRVGQHGLGERGLTFRVARLLE